MALEVLWLLSLNVYFIIINNTLLFLLCLLFATTTTEITTSTVAIDRMFGLCPTLSSGNTIRGIYVFGTGENENYQQLNTKSIS